MPDEPVIRTLVDDVEVPPGAEHVEVRRITMAPGVAAGPHWHNGPVFGVVLRGSVAFRIGDGETHVLRSGDTFHEPSEVTIRRFDALEEGAEFLAWYLLPPGEEGVLTPE